MKKNIVLLAVFALVLALAPTAQAELVIYVNEDTVNSEVHFLWNGLIGNGGTNLDLGTVVWEAGDEGEEGFVLGELRYPPGTFGGSADFIRAPNTTGSNLSAADRSRDDVDNLSTGGWEAASHYQGTAFRFGLFVDGMDFMETDFVVTSNTPFAMRGFGGLDIGYLNGNSTPGTGVPDLNSDVFTGSFSLPGDSDRLHGTDAGDYSMFNTLGTDLDTNTTVNLWQSDSFATGGGSIVFNGNLIDGDTDLDGDVDNADVGALIGSFTGSTGTGKTWFDGDSDFDGDVDNSDVGALIGAFTGALAGNLTDSGTIANLCYDPVTGNLTIDASEAQVSGTITSFQLESDAGFTDANYISATGGTFGGTFEDVSDSVLGDSDFTFAGFSGLYNMGNVAPTGLTLLGLESFLTNAVYTGSSGSGQETFDLVVKAVPEPTSLVLLGLGSLMMLRRRRR